MPRSDVSQLAELVGNGIDQRTDARTRTPGTGRVRRAFADLSRCGLNYAAVNLVASSPRPIDPKTIWDWFTGRRSRWVDALEAFYPPAGARRRILEQALRVPHARGIEYHYDLSNDFYRLFLDRDYMLYSSADFTGVSDTLEIAQARKVSLIVDLVDPKPEERILESGCGWGGMLRMISEKAGSGANLVGYTLSQEQARHIRGTSDHEIKVEDFLTADLGQDRYDAIYGVEALEHVKPDEIGPLYAKFYAALKPGGRMVQQYFSLDGDDPFPASMITAQLFFPGSSLSTQSHHLACFKQAGFRFEHASRHDYRPTLRAWFDRLVENKARAIELVGLETAQKYLAFFAASYHFFDRGEATLHRLRLAKDA